LPSTTIVIGASSISDAAVKRGPSGRGVRAARYTKGLKAEPGWRRASTARLNWLSR
jgi:hypothetical protein